MVAEKERRENEMKENLTDLAESVSESGAGDASTDDDNVGVSGVSGSTFSVSGRGRGDAVHRGLGSRLSSDLFVGGDVAINRNDERENRDDDRSQRVLIQSHRHHFHPPMRSDRELTE